MQNFCETAGFILFTLSFELYFKYLKVNGYFAWMSHIFLFVNLKQYMNNVVIVFNLVWSYRWFFFFNSQMTQRERETDELCGKLLRRISVHLCDNAIGNIITRRSVNASYMYNAVSSGTLSARAALMTSSPSPLLWRRRGGDRNYILHGDFLRFLNTLLAKTFRRPLYR